MSIQSRRFLRRTGSTPTSTVNLLAGKLFTSTVPLSTTETGNPLSNITDGSLTTRWVSEPTSPVLLTADLGAVYDLTKVSITWAADTVKNYSISVSTNMSTWTVVATGVTNNTTSQTIDHTSWSASARAQYLRITGTDRWDAAYGNSIWEAKAYGTYVSPGAVIGSISGFTATANGTTAMNLSWNYTGASLTNFVLKRGGTTIATLPASARSYADSGLTASTSYTYTLTGTYTAGGSTGSITATGNTNAAASNGGRFSGLAFPSLVFKSNGDLGVAAQFETDRGRPVDGAMSFSTYQNNWADFRWLPDGVADYINSGHIYIWAMPHAPETEGRAMNAQGAADAYRTEQTALAQWLTSQGYNSPNFVIRLDWEFNGDWYPWASFDPANLKQAMKNCINNMRAGGLTKVKFDLCANAGTSPGCASFESVWPGPGYFDIIGIDSYDWDPAATDASGWAGQLAHNPSLSSVVQLAQQYGVQWALDEGGNIHSSTEGGNVQSSIGGNDNVYYWQRMWDFVNANAATCHHHTTYDDPGDPPDLHHDFVSNPNSWAYYKRPDRWGG